MAIQIRAQLTASPNPTSLPRRIDFRQTLRSNLNDEEVVLVYQMDPDHDVWFRDGDGNPATGPEPTVVVVGDLQELKITKAVSVVGGGPAVAGATLEYVVPL